MSFSYNETLVLESNMVIEGLLSKLDSHAIVETIKNVALETVTLPELMEEFKGINTLSKIEGEHIKNYFVIAMNGIQLLWSKLVKEQESLVSCQNEPLYENVFTYFDLLVDEINFETLFQKELLSLNKE
jgi:hypothetical protein